MNGISKGEGLGFFPYFFRKRILLALFLCCCLFPLDLAAQKMEKEELSRFDRLAEEATLLNKHGQYDQVLSLLEPLKGDKKNDSALFFNELGIAYRHRGKLAEAIQAYRQSLR